MMDSRLPMQRYSAVARDVTIQAPPVTLAGAGNSVCNSVCTTPLFSTSAVNFGSFFPASPTWSAQPGMLLHRSAQTSPLEPTTANYFPSSASRSVLSPGPVLLSPRVAAASGLGVPVNTNTGGESSSSSENTSCDSISNDNSSVGFSGSELQSGISLACPENTLSSTHNDSHNSQLDTRGDENETEQSNLPRPHAQSLGETSNARSAVFPVTQCSARLPRYVRQLPPTLPVNFASDSRFRLSRDPAKRAAAMKEMFERYRSQLRGVVSRLSPAERASLGIPQDLSDCPSEVTGRIMQDAQQVQALAIARRLTPEQAALHSAGMQRLQVQAALKKRQEAVVPAQTSTQPVSNDNSNPGRLETRPSVATLPVHAQTATQTMSLMSKQRQFEMFLQYQQMIKAAAVQKQAGRQ
ncbi:MAG: hypothetical protein MHM6MM_004673 [Cercozoa sp. M6MM]